MGDGRRMTGEQRVRVSESSTVGGCLRACAVHGTAAAAWRPSRLAPWPALLPENGRPAPRRASERGRERLWGPGPRPRRPRRHWLLAGPSARARRRRGGRQRGTRRAMARMRVPRESSLARSSPRSDLAHGSRAGAPRTRRAARARTARRARTFRTTRSEPRPLRLRAPAKLYAVSSARSRSFLLPGRQNSYARLRFRSCVG